MKKKYNCPWCHEEFTRDVNYKPRLYNGVTKTSGSGEGKASANSTPVRCPKCLNLIPTWKKEKTDNIVGRKHIHIRS